MYAAEQEEHDNRLRKAVLRQLNWEPEIVSKDIGIAARNGVLTLSGFVDSYFEKVAAEKAVKSVYGVQAVVNDIKVKLGLQRTDPEC